MIYLITLALSAIFITQGVKLLMDEQLEMLKLYLAIYDSEEALGIQHMHTMEEISQAFSMSLEDVRIVYEAPGIEAPGIEPSNQYSRSVLI